MPRKRAPFGGAEYAIIGLLSLGPSHGYEIGQRLGERGPLRGIVTLGRSDLYAQLKKLESLGLIAAEEAARSSDAHSLYPPRRVYSLTDGGREHLAEWLARPVTRNREVRSTFALKLYLAAHSDDLDAIDLVDRQLAVVEESLSRFVDEKARRESAARTSAEERRIDEGFARMTLGLSEVATRGTIEWLRDWARPFAMRAQEEKSLLREDAFSRSSTARQESQ